MPRIQIKAVNSNHDIIEHTTHIFSSVPKGSVDSHVDQDVATGLTKQCRWGGLEGFLMRWPHSMTHWIAGCQEGAGRYQLEKHGPLGMIEEGIFVLSVSLL